MKFWQLVKALLTRNEAWDVPSYRMARFLKEIEKNNISQDVRQLWKLNNIQWK